MSTLKVDTIQDTNAVEMYLCKAWVNFDGTGTIAIRESGNVSSLTDAGAGYYSVNFTNYFSDANYSVIATSNSGAAYGAHCRLNSTSTSNITIYNYYGNSQAGLDASTVCVAVFR